MRKNNNRMQVVALQTTIGQLEAEKLGLSQALTELGYCHDQQTVFITESMSGPHGNITQATLLREAQAALAEAVSTNKDLTEELEFQAHRYDTIKGSLGHSNRGLLQAQDQITNLSKRLYWAKRLGYVVCALAIGQALQNAGVIQAFWGF